MKCKKHNVNLRKSKHGFMFCPIGVGKAFVKGGEYNCQNGKEEEKE